MLAFNGDIAKVPAALKTAAFDSVDKSAAQMEKIAKFATPVDDKSHGTHIRDSIRTENGDASIHERLVTIGDAAHEYVLPLEYGHVAPDGSHVPANPFWIPSTRKVNKAHKGRIARAIRKALRGMFP
jgi:hypothetical protein